MCALRHCPGELATSYRDGIRFFEAAPAQPAGVETYLLLHGLGNSLDFWAAVAPTLAGNRRTIAVDIPGFGQSRTAPGQITLHGAADALLRLCDTLSVKDCVLVAHSMGAFVALQMISQAPAGFRRLILVDGTLGRAVMVLRSPRQAVADPALTGYVLAQFAGGVVPLSGRALRLLTGSRLLRHATLWPYVARPGQTDPALLARALADNGSTGVAQALDAARHVDYTGLLRSVTCPVDLVWGAADHLIEQADIDQARAELPVERTLRLADCGHWPMIEQPAALARFIISFAPQSGI